VRRELMVAMAASALGVAACGGSSSNASGGSYPQASATKSAPATRPAAGVTVKVGTTELGRILTDGNGRTLYLFEKDKGAASQCSGACSGIWPPLTAATGAAGRGVVSSDLGSIKRADGTKEATYAGHPLYTYAGDSKPGDTHGQGLDQFGAQWYALAPDGKKVDDD
jgi:predicted lipoprotein with Yx(FWY)xxD motif